MKKKYALLTPGLYKTADAVKEHMVRNWGFKASAIVVEKAPPVEAKGIRPTFYIEVEDHLVCVEASESAYPKQIDGFVRDCHLLALPVKIWVAMPDTQTTNAQDLRLATTTGVGVLLVGATCQTLKPALMLSLAAVRNPDSSSYPPRFRQVVDAAYSTFIQGDPVGASASVYKAIEGLTRGIAIRATKKALWKQGTTATPPDASNPKTAFKTIAQFLHNYFNEKGAKAPKLDNYLWAEVMAAAGSRNDVSHPAKSASARRARDQRARTRFESACDLLRDLSNAALPLKISIEL
jgi:hypothetical protein